MPRILVTGAWGFIGSHFVRHVLTEHEDTTVVGVGRNTSQHSLKRIADVKDNRRFKQVFCDIAKDDVTELFDDVDYAVHFAAKTFVDHSIRDPKPFI